MKLPLLSSRVVASILVLVALRASTTNAINPASKATRPSSSASRAPPQSLTASASPVSSSTAPTGQANSFWFWKPSSFLRIKWLSSLVVKNTLYLDGGDVWITGEDRTYGALGSTVAIDLTQSWTPSNVQPYIVDKPRNFPLSRNQYMWYNTAKQEIQALPGTLYGTNDPVLMLQAQSFLNAGETEHEMLWTVDLSSAFSSWAASSNQPPAEYLNSYYTGLLSGASHDSWFGLGGLQSQHTSDPTPLFGRLLQYNFDTLTWQNKSTINYGPGGYGLGGHALYSDQYGDNGVLIFIGGFAPHNGFYEPPGNTGLQSMSVITIYDVAHNEFLNQTTTGSHPPPRVYFCSAAAAESGTGTLDIFIFGGVNPVQNKVLSQDKQLYDPGLAGMWILSIPSFIWTFVPNSNISMRADMTCQTLGSRQLAVIGGLDPTDPKLKYPSPDPWPNAIGLFDLVSLEWIDRYDAIAGTYTRASLVSKAASATPTPTAWNAPQLRDIFNPLDLNSGSSRTNVGAIAGGVVGGVCGAGLLLAAALYWARKRRQWRGNKHSDTGIGKEEGGRDVRELDSNQGPYYEMQGQNYRPELMHEKEAEPVRYELEAAERRRERAKSPYRDF